MVTSTDNLPSSLLLQYTAACHTGHRMVLTTQYPTGFAICHECVPNYGGGECYNTILVTEEEALRINPGIQHYICCIGGYEHERSEACKARAGYMIKQKNLDDE